MASNTIREHLSTAMTHLQSADLNHEGTYRYALIEAILIVAGTIVYHSINQPSQE